MKALLRIAANNIMNAAFMTAAAVSGAVLIGCRRRNGHVAIQVIDTGVGIAQSDQKAVFEEFHRLSGGRVPSQSELDAARAAKLRADAAVKVAEADVAESRASVLANEIGRDDPSGAGRAASAGQALAVDQGPAVLTKAVLLHLDSAHQRALEEMVLVIGANLPRVGETPGVDL